MVFFSKIVTVKALFIGVMSMVAATVAQAQDVRVFGDGPLTVRLCPATCQAVNGHGYKPGQPAQVLETKDGWARVSGYLPRRQLIASFGWRAVPRRPALWVALSSLRTATAEPTPAPRAEQKPVAKKKARRVDVVTRLARLRNPSVPSFRPGTQIASDEAPASVTSTEAPAEPEKPVEVAVAEPEASAPALTVVETVPEPVAEPAKPGPVEPEVVEASPASDLVTPTPVASAEGTKSETLTWEQLQARLAAQREAASNSAAATDDTAARQATEAAEAEAARIAQENEARRAAEAARKAEADRLAKEEADKLAKEAEAKKVAEAKALADERAAQQAREKAQADEAARQKAEADRIAREKAEAEALAKAEREKAAEEQRRLAEAAAAKIAAKQAAPKTAGSVGYTPPQPEAASTEAPVAAKREPEPETTQVAAAKLPPVAPAPAPAPEATPAATEEPQFSGPEPTYRSAEPAPMEFGSRPSKLTKALMDKRLSKLPGRKSKMPREIVIALRHYGLGLLKNGECKGVARGGISANPGMIFIACTDDPTYLRQFPLEEQSW